MATPQGFSYKGFFGLVEYDPEHEGFYGGTVNTRDLITFGGRSVDEIQASLEAAVGEYLRVCESEGVEPEKPYNGRVTFRMPPELHRAAAMAAAQEHSSLNSWLAGVVAARVGEG